METRFAFSRGEGLRGVPWLIVGGLSQFAVDIKAQTIPGALGQALSESTADKDLHMKWQGEDILLLEAEVNVTAAQASYSDEAQSDSGAAEAKVVDMQKNLQQAKAEAAQVPVLTDGWLQLWSLSCGASSSVLG